MPEWLLLTLLVLATLIGVGAAAFLVMRSPAFWADVVKTIATALVPEIIKIISQRMTTKEEAEFQKTARRGQEWDPFRKRPREK